jgi:hypothetical protein
MFALETERTSDDAYSGCYRQARLVLERIIITFIIIGAQTPGCIFTRHDRTTE